MTELRSDSRRMAGFLNCQAARWAAFGVFLAMAGALGWVHREDILPTKPAAAPVNAELAQCLAGRSGQIERMRADGVIDEAQATLFKGRAEALCWGRFGPGAGPPPPRRN